MLILSRRSGESLIVGTDIEIKIVEVAGDQVKIGITAPKECRIMRKELCLTQESNIEAAQRAHSKDALLTFLARYHTGDKKKDD